MWLLTTATALPPIPTTTLPGGAKLPMLYMGAGNFTTWLEMAGRGAGVKTAWTYHNQPAVLPQVYVAGLSREDVFLETMIPCGAVDHPQPMSAEEAEGLIAQDLALLNTSYVDLLLLHHRCNTPNETARVWRVLEAARHRGVARSIGVSNFDADDLALLLQAATLPIEVNEAHFAVGVMDWDTISFARSHQIQLVSFSSLAAAVPMDHPTLAAIADRLNVSTATIMYKYVSAHGIAVLSSMSDAHPEYAAQDAAIFGLELTSADAAALDALQAGRKRTCPDCFTDVCQACAAALVARGCFPQASMPAWGRDNPHAAQCLACAAAANHSAGVTAACGAQFMVDKACGQAGGFPTGARGGARRPGRRLSRE